MIDRYFLSPNEITISDTTPLVMLQGPVQGAPDWRTPFADRLLEAHPHIVVASPQVTPQHEASLNSASEAVNQRAADKQVAWEFLARGHAMDLGVIAMWWAGQDRSLPHKAGRRYGKTSHVENGEGWGWMRAFSDYPFITGFDSSYEASGENSKNYILRNMRIMGLSPVGSLDEMFDEISSRLPTPGTTRVTSSSAAQSMQRALDLLRSE